MFSPQNYGISLVMWDVMFPYIVMLSWTTHLYRNITWKYRLFSQRLLSLRPKENLYRQPKCPLNSRRNKDCAQRPLAAGIASTLSATITEEELTSVPSLSVWTMRLRVTSKMEMPAMSSVASMFGPGAMRMMIEQPGVTAGTYTLSFCWHWHG